MQWQTCELIPVDLKIKFRNLVRILLRYPPQIVEKALPRLKHLLSYIRISGLLLSTKYDSAL